MNISPGIKAMVGGGMGGGRGGLIIRCTFYKERAPNYLITFMSFCRFTPSIKVVAFCYL